MKSILTALVLGVSLLLASGGGGYAQDFQKGAEAYHKGDYATALREWRPLAEQGNAIAQFNLGLMYYNGQGVPQDYKEAANWYRKSAEQGDADAQYQLALMYKNGEGTEQNLTAALSWASKAYQQGHTESEGLYAELVFQDLLYGSDVRALENLGESLANLCENDIKCAFDKVWAYLDVTGDGNLSLSEIARFQRNIIKTVAFNQGGESLETEEVAAINFASIIVVPITASSILHSFDYNNDGLLSKNEVFGETEFAKLVGLNSTDFAKGIDFKILGERLEQVMELIPLFK